MLYNNILLQTYSPEGLNASLISFYSEWKERYLRTVSNTYPTQQYLFYTLDQPNLLPAVTCSEAMGYGMFIFPMMSIFDPNAKHHFHALYCYIQHYPSFYNPNLMAWQQIMAPDGHIINATSDTSSATDGDMDISYGLLLAHRLWEQDKDIDYLQEARLHIQALMTSCVSPKDSILYLGDWVSGLQENDFKYVTRSSDFMGYLIKIFAQVDRKNKRRWLQVLSRINHIIDSQLTRQSKTNGLMPDFFKKEGKSYMAPTSQVLESLHDGDYFYNSCRTPWRYAMNSILFHSPTSYEVHLLNQWIKKKTKGMPSQIVSGYYIANGIPGDGFGEPNNLAFIAPFLVSAIAEKGNDAWILSLWNALLAKPIDECTFYENTLKLIAMIIATGNWLSPI